MQPHPLFTPYKQAFLHQCPKGKNEPFILTLVEVNMPAERQDRNSNLHACLYMHESKDSTRFHNTTPPELTQEHFSLSPGKTFGIEQAKLTLKFFTTTNLFTCSYLKAGFLHAPHG
jgi:hypothetical protein